MHKLLLHIYLPSELSHAIFFDSDVLVRNDLRLVWRLFDDFAPGQMIGLAEEANPFHSQASTRPGNSSPGKSSS